MSRTNARSKALRRRPSRSVPAIITALVMIALGVALGWLGIARLTNGTWPSVLRSTGKTVGSAAWSAGTTIAVLAVTAVLGLILLLAALIRGRFNSVNVAPRSTSSDVEDTDFVITRHGIAKLATARAGMIDGVDSVSTTATGSRVRMNIRTPSRQNDEIKSRVTQSVQSHLEAAGLQPVPRVAATVSTKDV